MDFWPRFCQQMRPRLLAYGLRSIFRENWLGSSKVDFTTSIDDDKADLPRSLWIHQKSKFLWCSRRASSMCYTEELVLTTLRNFALLW